MLDTNISLLPKKNKDQKGPLRVLAVGLETREESSLDEMQRLLSTLGLELVKKISFALREINPATYITKGKVEELGQEVKDCLADAVVIDAELSPNQIKNLEKALGGHLVLDRPGVIIEIFSKHAKTKEAKTQVELARLNYLLPRLTHFWSHFERQRGGIGQKGMGEKQLEVDRRLVKKRISILEERLKSVRKERSIRRSGRRDFSKVALVGYTNAGKSTLLNALTESKVLAENKLFSTLDSSVKALNPDSHPPVVAIDTVGFIERLPTTLIASFRSTLEELEEADFLLHVVDGSSPKAKEQIEVTESVLKDLKLDGKPRAIVLNKMDLVKTISQLNWARAFAPKAIRVSAYDKEQVKKLRQTILSHFTELLEVIDVVIPYSESKLESQIRKVAQVDNQKYLESGTFYRIRIPTHWIQRLKLDLFKP